MDAMGMIPTPKSLQNHHTCFSIKFDFPPKKGSMEIIHDGFQKVHTHTHKLSCTWPGTSFFELLVMQVAEVESSIC